MHLHPNLPAGRFRLDRFAAFRVIPALLAVAALALPLRSSAFAPEFNTLNKVSTNSSFYSPSSSATGDFNGDGKLDAFVSDGGAIRMLLGNGDGTFIEHDLGVPAAGAIHAADLNGDGRLDIVFVRPQSTLNPGVLLNTGNDANGIPQFTLKDYSPLYGGIRSLAVGDLNGDGHPDFVVGSAYAAVQVYLNDGTGDFTVAQSTSLLPGQGGPAVGAAVIADLNGDGKPDYLVTSAQNGAANLFLGNGDGTLQTPIVIANGAISVAVGDLNQDGLNDFVLGNYDGTAMVYLNTGNATFAAPVTYTPIANAAVTSLVIADVNADGNPDILANNGNSNGASADGVAILAGDGSGTFSAVTTFALNVRPFDLSVADFNGDGKPDIGSIGAYDKTYASLLNVTPDPLPTQTLTILGGSGNPGDIATDVEYFNPATNHWQPAYLASYAAEGHPGGHPWGNISGTNSWINYKVDGASDPGAGPYENNTLWYLYRVRFTVPADAVNPRMTFSLKADNFAQVAINDVDAGGLITGQADQLNADAVFSQAVHPGENTITIDVGDFGGLNGFNFRIDLSMDSATPLEIVPANTDTTPPVIMAPGDITAEATSADGASVNFSPTAVDDIDGPVPVVAVPGSGSLFPLGTTQVDLGATDAAGNTAFASFHVTVQDTTAPALTLPAGVTAEATGPDGAAVAYTDATATDAVGVTGITYSAASGSTFPLGTTAVTVTASDAAGNHSSGTFDIVVQDTTAPVLTVPAAIHAEATSAAGAAVSYPAATATDAVGVTGITYSAASGSTFPLGTTTVTATASDAAGNTTSRTFDVSVVDTTPPALALPADVIAEATGPDGATVSYPAASASDAVGVADIAYSVASGTTFALGTTDVVVTARDTSGNATSGTFHVTVRDTTAPALAVPADIVAEATSASGAAVDYPAATATDAVGVTTLDYTVPSGATFPLGTTSVGVTAGDAAGNTSSGAFTITVRDTTAPTVNGVTPSTATIWPPNKKMVPITVSVDATDAVGIASARIVSVATNQPDARTQWAITGPLTVNLLADRSGRDGARIYTITVEVSDAAGNVTTATTTVTVPHDQREEMGESDHDHGQIGGHDDHDDDHGHADSHNGGDDDHDSKHGGTSKSDDDDHGKGGNGSKDKDDHGKKGK